jgi:integrase
MILLTFRHGPRAAEVVDLRWEQVDFKNAFLHVGSRKDTPANHPLTAREMRSLRKHQRDNAASSFVFVSERGAPLTAHGFSAMVERAGVAADLGIKGSRTHASSCRGIKCRQVTCGRADVMRRDATGLKATAMNDSRGDHILRSRKYRGRAEAYAKLAKATDDRLKRAMLMHIAKQFRRLAGLS